jgi:hypothetical protein
MYLSASRGMAMPLAVHIIEVNSNGKGDKINRKDIFSIQQGNAKESGIESAIAICEKPISHRIAQSFSASSSNV